MNMKIYNNKKARLQSECNLSCNELLPSCQKQDNKNIISKISQKASVHFRVIRNNKEFDEYEISGRVAQTLYALVLSQSNGITSLEISSSLRLSEYIRVLRRRYRLDIQTMYEPHEGGYHGRYILYSDIQIMAIHDYQQIV